MIILHFRLVIMIWRRCQKFLINGNGVFSGTGMPDMLDNAWLAIKIPAETTKNDTLTESQCVEPLLKAVDNLLVTVSFRWTKRRYNKSAAMPIQKQHPM